MKDIAFHPQGYSTHDVQQQVSAGEMTPADVSLLFGDELGNAILRAQSGQRLPEGGPCQGLTDSTQIIIWGVPKSGKTMVIASLLAQEGMTTETTSIQGIDERTGRLQQLFRRPGSYQLLPDTSSHPRSENYHAVYRKGWWSPAYPLTFIEARLTGEPFPYPVLNKEQEQIHILCLDCRQDLHAQVSHFRTVLQHLQANDYLEHTSALYVLVTKSDLLNAPLPYREGCAQTLVTSILPDFWRELLNICYDHSIYNTQPIAYSVGHFVLKDFARLSPDHEPATESLFANALLPKCQPRRSVVGKVLDVGKPVHAVILAVLFAAIIGWGLYAAHTSHLTKLTASLEPFDYKAYFLNEVEAMREADFNQACEDYDRLFCDLAYESSIHDNNGERVVSAEDYKICDSCLVEVFCKLIREKASTLFGHSDWTSEESQLRRIAAQIKKVESHLPQPSGSTALEKYAVFINDYFNTVKPLVEGSKACHSVDGVVRVENECRSWNRYPYSNDRTLSNALDIAPLSAYESCARYFHDRVNTLIDDYERMKDEAPWYDITVYFGDKSSLEDALENIQGEVLRLKEKLDNKTDARYDDAKSLVLDTLSSIERYV